MLPETTLTLAAIDNIVGIKEASGNIEQVRRIISGAPENFAVLSGEDSMNFDIYNAGGHGCISVTATWHRSRRSHMGYLYRRQAGRSRSAARTTRCDKQGHVPRDQPNTGQNSARRYGAYSRGIQATAHPMGLKHREELLDTMRMNGIV